MATPLRKYEVQYVINGETFRDGYGFKRFFTKPGAVLWMVMAWMEYGHVFHYRLLRERKVQIEFPGDLFS